jgi:class 3 adenylate cyclase
MFSGSGWWIGHPEPGDPALGGIMIDGERPFDAATAFVDVRGSTALTGSLGVRKMRDFLQLFFAGVLDRIVAQDGRLCDINGDGVLAVFRGDGRVDRALAAAIAVERMVADGTQFGSVSGIRVGIDDGQVCRGYVGEGLNRHQFWVGANVAAKVSRMLAPSDAIGITGRALSLLSSGARESSVWSAEEGIVIGGEELAVRTRVGERADAPSLR